MSGVEKARWEKYAALRELWREVKKESGLLRTELTRESDRNVLELRDALHGERKKVESLKKELAHWKSKHTNLAKKLADLMETVP